MSCMQNTYRMFTALHEDTDKGWVWLLLSEKQGFRSRNTIRITCGNRSVYCEHRNFDENFVRRYDAADDTTCMYFGLTEPDHAKQKDIAQHAVRHRDKVHLTLVSDIIVISSWYRKALGNPDKNNPQPLTICKPRSSQWADMRAACQHPEPTVRIAMRAALVGTWLGVAAFLPAIAAVQPMKSWLEETIRYPEFIALLLAAAFGIACLFAGRGVQR